MDVIILIMLAVLIALSLILIILKIKPNNSISSMGELISNNQKTLGKLQNERLADIDKEMKYMNESVSRRLEQMHRSIGEIHSLTNDVGDLKKILSNVKTRGILGEMQCKAILGEILAPEQYVENCRPIPGSRNVVEFAVKLPGTSDMPVYLPIDSKFPGTLYHNLCDAYEIGDTDEIDDCIKALMGQLNKEAADIHGKYVEPPYTTDFAIMFLPFEGLYNEAVNHGMVELLQKKYNIALAGPSTLAVILNSLLLGFNTLAVEKKAGEVWKTLSEVRTEFEKFGETLENAHRHADMLCRDLEKLKGTRTNTIMKKLNNLQN